MRFIALLLLAVAPLVSQAASAQDAPGRVGRVSFMEGSVAVYHDPDIGWEGAFVNSPITSENSLWTEPDSRAELQVSATAIRLDGATQLDVSRLDDDALHASLVRGSVGVRVRHNDYGTRYVFDTPEARFTITREGRYRIDVDPEVGESRLAVFRGEAFMETADGRRRIEAGRMVRVAGGDYFFERAASTDFDRWTYARDERWVERNSTRYVSTYVTGYEDLDTYGEWIQDPAYGALWVPTTVSAEWVPYRYGRWTYMRPWGWTWVDDQPWGYAPFHYGRWVHVRDRWCWYPGRQREARPAWAPALVAWVGGSNWSVGASSGQPVLGWYPLAPTERFQPWYRANTTYVNRVNNIVVNNVTVNQYYGSRPPQDVNRTAAVTAVTRENLIERKPVQQAMVRVAPDAARSAPPAQVQAFVPNNTEIQRMRVMRSQSAPPSVRSMPSGQPSAQPSPSAPAPQVSGNAIGRGERAQQPTAPAPQVGAGRPPITAPQVAPGAPVAPIARPNFARPQAAPAPAPAQANTSPAPAVRPSAGAPVTSVPSAQPPAAAAPAPAPQTNPLSRGAMGRERGEQERAQREAQQQQQQQEAQRRAVETQQRAQQQQQQQQQEAQRRGAAEAQQRAQQQQQQQEAQRRAAEAQQREAQQRASQQQQEAQRRAAEAQQRAAEEQRRAQQQQEAQRRATEAQRAQQQAQERAAREQQAAQQREAQQRALQQQQEAQRRAAEAQQRAAQEQQRALQQQQEAQRRAAEAQQQRAAPQQPPAPAPQAAPQAQGNPAARGNGRGHPQGERPDNEDKDKDNGKGPR